MIESLAVIEALGLRPILVTGLGRDALLVIGGGLVLIDSDLDTKGLEQIVEQVVSAAMDELVKQEAE